MRCTAWGKKARKPLVFPRYNSTLECNVRLYIYIIIKESITFSDTGETYYEKTLE